MIYDYKVINGSSREALAESIMIKARETSMIEDIDVCWIPQGSVVHNPNSFGENKFMQAMILVVR